jgi:uncharacterized protein YjbI with pentapeptide repeats
MVKAFISYSWDNDDHKSWVRQLASRLRGDGIDVTLDQWHLVPGDELPKFMEQAVRESEYVLIVCTHKYKERSNNRQGGVGYEGDIMTAEVISTGNQRKFIPILRQQPWVDSAPSWLLGKYYIDFSSSAYSETSYDDLLTTLLGTREKAPPIGAGKKDESLTKVAPGGPRVLTHLNFEPVQITGIIVDQVGTPRNDDTRGSALYRVPFRMSQRPPHEWAEIFVNSWNHPPSFTSAHRPGIASVISDTIVLDGTTIEEVRDYHRNTLLLCVQEANKKYKELSDRWKQDNELEQERLSKHKRNIDDISNQIEFNPTDEIATSEGILSRLTRKDVLEIIQTARSQGKTPELRNAKLTGIDLNGENLSGVDFTKADLSFADLEQANLENTIFQGANLDQAILIRAHMKNANLRRASLKDTNLYKPTLTNADLSEVDLKPTRVNFDEARLDYAKLFETDLSGHDLTRAILTGAEYSSSTVWPHDFDPEKAGAILKCNSQDKL